MLEPTPYPRAWDVDEDAALLIDVATLGRMVETSRVVWLGVTVTVTGVAEVVA